ncbi:multiprotein-bridging factor 1 family protein [Halobium salinum]|uniref:Multiprotein-bridging factor 1 family protein n=1 Tax=Halobium salinum TaxID=1364940 RepID=A0ABD5PF14_9EURY|nr:multiprotein-bridging factor 1 family protein [Halobium salinum]
MAKYSTGRGGGDDDGDACELCGKESGKLRRANVAGANLLVCPDCAPHDDSRKSSGGGRGRATGSGGGGSGGGAGSDDYDSGPKSRKQEVAQKAAKMYDAGKGDSKRWEKEGTSYEKDRLPYLVSDYGDVVEQARQDAGLTVEDLAAELDVDEDDLLAVEQNRATRAGVGGSVISKLEDRLGVELADE